MPRKKPDGPSARRRKEAVRCFGTGVAAQAARTRETADEDRPVFTVTHSEIDRDAFVMIPSSCHRLWTDRRLPASGNMRNLLVVDDNMIGAACVVALLRHEGFDTQFATAASRL
jgi:hypothetical protein